METRDLSDVQASMGGPSERFKRNCHENVPCSAYTMFLYCYDRAPSENT